MTMPRNQLFERTASYSHHFLGRYSLERQELDVVQPFLMSVSFGRVLDLLEGFGNVV